MWAVPSRSTRRAMVCPGSSAAAIACAATSFPTLPFKILDLSLRGPRILPLGQAPPAPQGDVG
eukprot:1150897-Pelagomonas_calceolata.AAC.1